MFGLWHEPDVPGRSPIPCAIRRKPRPLKLDRVACASCVALRVGYLFADYRQSGHYLRMGLAELYYLEVALVLGLVATIGVGVIGFRQPAYHIARACSWIGGALFVSIAIVWGTTTKETPIIWLPVVGIIGALGAMGLVGALRAINFSEAQEKADIAQRPVDAVFQAGAIVGKVYGGRRSPTDATLFEFREIAQAGQFNMNEEFEYDGYVLKAIRINSRTGLNTSRPQDGTILEGVIAKVIRRK
jgi:hypothetical protein